MPRINVERKQTATDLMDESDGTYEPTTHEDVMAQQTMHEREKEQVKPNSPNPHVLKESKYLLKKMINDTQKAKGPAPDPRLVPVYSQLQLEAIQDAFVQKTAQLCTMSAGVGLVVGFFAYKLLFASSISNSVPELLESAE